MANPCEILKTKNDELVLEKLFNEYMVPWYREKAIKAVIYDKARREIEDLKAKKSKRQEKKPREDVHDGTKQTDKQQTNRKEEMDLQRLLSENIAIKGRLEDMKAEIRKTRADADVELCDKEQQLERLRKALENSVEQVNTLTLRLRKLAGDKLQQRNPDLAELSDPNRPTELGTRFSEIYDNEWSDAFDHIQIQDEEKRVRLLHGIVMAAFSFCYLKFEEQTYQVRATLLCLEQEAIPADPSSDKTEFLSVKFEQFITGVGLSHRKIHPTLREYARKCAEICWFMMVCDPHMTLSEDKEGAEFDTNVYKPYTQSVRDMKRPIVKLNVWPALLLHMSGPLVARGVAQPVEGKAN